MKVELTDKQAQILNRIVSQRQRVEEHLNRLRGQEQDIIDIIAEANDIEYEQVKLEGSKLIFEKQT